MVICPRCFLWSMSPEHVLDVKQPVADFHKRHPGAIGMHKMLYDAMRAVDVISAIAGVDSENIGGCWTLSWGEGDALFIRVRPEGEGRSCQ